MDYWSWTVAFGKSDSWHSLFRPRSWGNETERIAGIEGNEFRVRANFVDEISIPLQMHNRTVEMTNITNN